MHVWRLSRSGGAGCATTPKHRKHGAHMPPFLSLVNGWREALCASRLHLQHCDSLEQTETWNQVALSLFKDAHAIADIELKMKYDILASLANPHRLGLILLWPTMAAAARHSRL